MDLKSKWILKNFAHLKKNHEVKKMTNLKNNHIFENVCGFEKKGKLETRKETSKID